MNNPEDIFRILSGNYERLMDPLCCNEFFNDEEECPYCEAAYLSIEKSITIYRTESIQRGIPGEVSMRLHTFIRKQWLPESGEVDEEGGQA